MRHHHSRQLNLCWVAAAVLTLVSQSETVSGYLQSSSSSSWHRGWTRKSGSASSSSSSLSSPNIEAKGQTRRRDVVLNKLGFRRQAEDHRVMRETEAAAAADKPKYRITTIPELDDYFADTALRFRKTNGEIDTKALLAPLEVVGDTQIIGSPDHPEYTHPVVQLLHQRRRDAPAQQGDNNNNKTTRRSDGAKIALSVEGGGMRGCVSAGMVCAIHHLNLTSSFDVVYGSSAGTVIAAYLITGQVPWFGPELYYDRLTTAGKEFIDSSRLLRALGLGLVDPRLLKDVLTRPRNGKPIVNLPFLFQATMQQTKPLDWNKFVEKQKELPLKVVAAGLKSEKSIVMDYEHGHFETLSELTDCMHASCLLPGIAGPVLNMDRRAIGRGKKAGLKKYVLGNNLQGDHYEPLADALVYEPLPFRSALAEGATHVVMIRSRPDGTDVTGKVSFFENLIFRRFFLRKNHLPRVFQRMVQRLHKKVYAQDVITLNQDAYSTRPYSDTTRPHLLTVALPPGSPEVTRLETGREAVFAGIRRGFARAYDCLVEDPAERGRGEIVAQELFPDEILLYDPLSIHVTDESAFAAYLRMNGKGSMAKL